MRRRHTHLTLDLTLSVLLGALLAAWVATELFAFSVRFPAVLGAHYSYLYPPWSIAIWWSWWHTDHPTLLNTSVALGAVAGAMLCFSSITGALQRRASLRAYDDVHGTARWARLADIRRAGLLSPTGVYVGAWKKGGKQYMLRHDGPEHVLCYAPSRSGKGVALVVPTMLSWLHSAVVTDLKGEIYELSAGWRGRQGQRVLRFEPANASESVAWNPFEEIRVGTAHETGDIQNLATLIVDPDGKGMESHWQKTACSLLTGCIAHVLYRGLREPKYPATLPALDQLLADPEQSLYGDKGQTGVYADMLSYLHKDGDTHPLAASSIREQLNRPHEEAGSVVSTALSYLSIYRDPVVAKNVSRSDFKVRDLMQSDSAVSLYIVTRPIDKDRLKPLIRVLINTIVRINASGLSFSGGMPKAHYKHRLLLMLDEFPALGKLDILKESLAFLAGYGIKAYLICQDINQLHTHYTRDEAITSNCHVQCAFPPNRIETAEHLSKLTGQTTVVKEQITTSGRPGAPASVSRSTQEISRPLLTADEAMRMRGPLKDANGMITEAGEMVVYVAGYHAIRCIQPLYFKDAELVQRARIPAPSIAK
jgi:type IV secretion system protein VirD4